MRALLLNIHLLIISILLALCKPYGIFACTLQVIVDHKEGLKMAVAPFTIVSYKEFS